MEPADNMRYPTNTFLLLQYNKYLPPWQPEPSRYQLKAVHSTLIAYIDILRMDFVGHYNKSEVKNKDLVCTVRYSWSLKTLHSRVVCSKDQTT